MDEFVEFKLKKAGGDKNKIILFIIVKKETINYIPNMKDQVIKKYIDIVKSQPELYICVDARKLQSISKKLSWEAASDLYRHNLLFSQHIRASSFLVSSQTLINIMKLIEKIHPFVSPTKFCKDNSESINFLYKYMN